MPDKLETKRGCSNSTACMLYCALSLTVNSLLCLLAVQVPCVTQFEAQLMIVELLEHNPVFTVSSQMRV